MTIPAEFTQILCNAILITKQRNQPSLTSARTRSNCTGDALSGSLQYQLQMGDGEEFKYVTLWFLWNLSAKSSFRNVSFGLSQVRRWKIQIPKSCYQPCQGLLQGPAASAEDTCWYCSITSSPSARKPLGLIFSQITPRTGRDECEGGKAVTTGCRVCPKTWFRATSSWTFNPVSAQREKDNPPETIRQDYLVHRTLLRGRRHCCCLPLHCLLNHRSTGLPDVVSVDCHIAMGLHADVHVTWSTSIHGGDKHPLEES